jgi:hypothetical protein
MFLVEENIYSQSYAKKPKGIRYMEFLMATNAVFRPDGSAREYILNLNLQYTKNVNR